MLLCCCILLNHTISASADALPATGKLVPLETILLVNIDNFQQLKVQFEKTSFYKLYKDPAMAAFVDSAKTKWKEKIEKLDDNDIFKAILSTDVLPQGRAAIALVLNEQSKNTSEPPIMIISQWGEGVDKIKEAVSKMLSKNIEAGGHQKRSEEYRGVSIEIAVDEASTELNYCFIDDCFIASTNLDLIKFAIAHIKGAESPALADDTDYSSIMKTVGPYRDIDLYVNIKQIIKMKLAEDPNGQIRQWVTNMGFDNVAAFGGASAVGRSSDSFCSGKALLKINGIKRGICKMLEAETAVLKAPRFIPASAYSATFFNLNIKKAYDELYNVLYSFNPSYASMMQMLDLPDSPEGEPGVKFKNDIIGNLGSQIVVYQIANKPFSSGSTPTESIMALAASNRGALEKSLAKFHSKMIAPNNPDARRELLGHTIYLLSSSGMPFLRSGLAPMQLSSEPNAPQMPTMAFTVTDTHLVFGSEAAVERAIRSLSSSAEASSLGSAKWFNSAKSAMPSTAGIAALEDNAASSEIFWWMAKQSGASGPAAMKFAPGEIGKLVNFDLLPQFDAVRKYFGVSTLYGISTPEGFLFEFQYISPTESPN